MSLFIIREYEKLVSDSNSRFSDRGYTVIPQSSFKKIWEFIIGMQGTDTAIEAAFSLYKVYGREVIQAKNYVGIVDTKQGDVIEILPKIYNGSNTELNLEENRKIFLRMLASLKDEKFKSLQSASLSTLNDFPILEIFIRNYIDEVSKIIISGLKKNYEVYEENSRFLKGSLVFAKDILDNLIDRSKFYIRHIKYQEDIPQNRIIVSTLIKLQNTTTRNSNRKDIIHLLNLLGDIRPSRNASLDLKRCKHQSRLFSLYERVIQWSEVFLKEEGFTNFFGEHTNQALLFPANVLFQNFVTDLFKRFTTSHRILASHSEYFLINSHNDRQRFNLKPDIYGQRIDSTSKSILIDTKWKIIDERSTNSNYGIKISDMYQMYAYGKKYSLESHEHVLVLIYPKNEHFTRKLETFFYEGTNNNYSLKLYVIPFDLTGGYETQIADILQSTIY